MSDVPAWREFEAGLAAVLAGFEDGERLIVFWRPRTYYVQAAQDDGELVVEAVSDSFLPEAERRGAPGAEALRAAGWTVPGAPDANWQHRLTWPARIAAYQDTAGMMVAALRDVFGVPEPSELTYRVWIEAPTGLREPLLPRLGITREH
jgi:hypothetical protein